MLLPLALPPRGRAESYADWLKKDREKLKDFKEGKTPAPEPAPAPQPPPPEQPSPTPEPPEEAEPEPEPEPKPEPEAPIAERAVRPERSTETDWLLMVYQAGDNNLDPYAIKDVKEMEKIGSSDRVKIAVLMDRLEGEEWSTARRFLVRHPDELGGKHSWDPSLDTCEDLGEVNMGDPAVLKKFVVDSLRDFPAENTMLVLWNHGGGWRSVMTKAVSRNTRANAPVLTPAMAVLSRGIAWDDTNNGDFLESREVRKALEPLPKLSIIGADACLMAMVEVAYEWRKQADFFVASEDLKPGNGWPYDTLLKALSEDPGMSPRDLAAETVNRYAESYKLQPTTQSALDMAALNR